MPRDARNIRFFGKRIVSFGTAGAVAFVIALSGCSQGETYQAPQFPFLKSYTAKKSGAPLLLTNVDWWQRFNDPVLDQLVAQALVQNLTLEAARERVVAARAEVQTIASPARVSSNVEVTNQGEFGSSSAIRSNATLGLDWMLDPFGARREQVKSSLARSEAAEAEVDAARLLVLYNLCNAYVELRYLERLLTLRREEIGSRKRFLQQANELLAANSAIKLDVTRAEARLADVQAQIPRLEADVRMTRNEIVVLTGRQPGSDGPENAQGRGQPRASLSADVGIPTDLLRNRPDIRISERLYYASIANIGVAKAVLYPRLSLTGAISLNAIDRGNSTRDYYFGPSLELPALPTKSARASVEVSRSRARQAHTAWKATVLGAILEVENSLLEYEGSQRSLSSAERSLRLYREAQTMMTEVFQTGGATFSDLIDAQQSVTQSANTLAETIRQQGLSFVALNVRVGSGSADTPPASQSAVAAPLAPEG